MTAVTDEEVLELKQMLIPSSSTTLILLFHKIPIHTHLNPL